MFLPLMGLLKIWWIHCGGVLLRPPPPHSMISSAAYLACPGPRPSEIRVLAFLRILLSCFSSLLVHVRCVLVSVFVFSIFVLLQVTYTAAAAAVYMCYVMRRSVFLPLKCSKDVESDKGDINMQLRCFVRRVKQWCEVLVFRSEEEKMTHLSER